MLRRLWDHDLAWSFRRSPVTVLAAVLTLVCVGAAGLSPWISPQDPFDAAALDLNAAFKPPAWLEGGDPAYPLGSDNQGRDILSTIMHGARISLGIGMASVLFALVVGVSLGLLSGYFGGRLDAVIMRIADVQLSFPAILIALLIDGVARVALAGERHEEIAIPVLVLSIGFAGWVQYARTVRGSTMVERNKEYVQAARVIGRRPLSILMAHVLPNVMGPVLVIAEQPVRDPVVHRHPRGADQVAFIGFGHEGNSYRGSRTCSEARSNMWPSLLCLIFMYCSLWTLQAICSGTRSRMCRP